MGELTCSKRGCGNRIEYQHIGEGDYYCEGCAYCHFTVSEFVKIGSAKIIKQMIELSKNLLDKVEDYAKKENMTNNWREALDQHKIFYEELDNIKIELDEALRAERVIISHSLQKRSTDLKSRQIIFINLFKYYISFNFNKNIYNIQYY